MALPKYSPIQNKMKTIQFSRNLQRRRILQSQAYISAQIAKYNAQRSISFISRDKEYFIASVKRRNDFLSPLGVFQARSLFIQTEETPNPSSLKFHPGTEVLPTEYGSSMIFKRSEGAQSFSNSPLAKSLFKIPGIDGLMLGSDFVSINKNETVSWSQLKPDVFSHLMMFFDNERTAVIGPKPETKADSEVFESEEEKEIVELIKELLEERIRPMVQEDGGDIYFHSFSLKTGVVTVQLAGSCEGCPSSSVTLKNGVENMLMHYIPEVSRVDQLYDEEELNQRTLSWTPST
eukprot:maker-scaffold_11-snap-gene-7.8-mRNA-1 protein AED:0.29 eAED:0.29 QI:223/1/1/1/1/1/2/57/290